MNSTSDPEHVPDLPAEEGGPVMDGANDDMSDSGTPKTEVSDLDEQGRADEAIPPDTTE